jgi:hypothetical protein
VLVTSDGPDSGEQAAPETAGEAWRREREGDNPWRGALFLVIAVAAALLLNAGYTTWAVSQGKHAVQQQARKQEISQAKQGVVLGARLCLTFGKLAALTPPPGSAAKNPSRVYLQEQHDTLTELGRDLGCRR